MSPRAVLVVALWLFSLYAVVRYARTLVYVEPCPKQAAGPVTTTSTDLAPSIGRVFPGFSVVRVRDARGAEYKLIDDPTDLVVSSVFRKGALWESWMHPALDAQCAALGCASAVVIDVGANVGSHTLYVARHGLAREVWAIEPQRRLYEQLVSNLLLNNVSSVWPLNMALSSAPAQLHMHHPRDAHNPSGRSIVTAANGRPIVRGEQDAAAAASTAASDTASTAAESSGTREEVVAQTLDSLWELRGRPRVALLKVDVEGFERHVFEGARQLLASECPVVFFEVGHEHGALHAQGGGAESVAAWLQRTFGYCVRPQVKGPSLAERNGAGPGHVRDMVAERCTAAGAPSSAAAKGLLPCSRPQPAMTSR